MDTYYDTQHNNNNQKTVTIIMICVVVMLVVVCAIFKSKTVDNSIEDVAITTSMNNNQVTKENTTSFYDDVNYLSPTAQPADIFKHGRNLMLLNNDYKLPEDFEWDLVYWTNGESVDALSLNSPEYDSVDAIDRTAYQPLKDMFAAAEKDGVPLELVSAYRSISLQDRLFSRSVNSYMSKGYSKEDAIKKANYSRTFSGTSEHNTGLGFDILQKGTPGSRESMIKGRKEKNTSRIWERLAEQFKYNNSWSKKLNTKG